MSDTKLATSLSRNVPRYTSYPTAPNFKPDVGQKIIQLLYDDIKKGNRISLYIHIPFCDRLCWFCGCHTKQTQQYAPVTQYVETLIDEIALHSQKLGMKPELAHIHFGGGSPSMLRSGDFALISDALHKAFIIDDKTEISVEIDPNDMSEDMLEGVQTLGMTRASIGVQDFDIDVQNAINRPQSFEQTRELVEALRKINIESINLDVLYGLPRQTMKRLQSTIEKALSLNPDRLAIFGYAHVPWVKKHQQMINDSELPDNAERFEQMREAERLFIEAGYKKIGIDHYAKPEDGLALAAERGVLRRNFQGYTTDNCDILLGLGGSSISRFSGGYIQNLVPTNLYRMKIEQGQLAAAKGYNFSEDDKIRGFMIERLMCDFEFSFEHMIAKFGPKATPYIELAKSFAEADNNQISAANADRFWINPEHLALTRVVASWFDAHLQSAPFKFSKAI